MCGFACRFSLFILLIKSFAEFVNGCVFIICLFDILLFVFCLMVALIVVTLLFVYYCVCVRLWGLFWLSWLC